ncbi:riboflavin biosynthesis protein PYRD, chloroplastic [Phoenix dactylifera]|uniref:Riboflavin biosynthesis protein PYRD, chloroplastic n=1 Tax=Phoenix dactylifera TaxID=42345 RepID=A0A8B7BX80_PHODC|nr:riboflavin biosynthesis protein PYRD, chloroplastic [Phoenix dactylifera]
MALSSVFCPLLASKTPQPKSAPSFHLGTNGLRPPPKRTSWPFIPRSNRGRSIGIRCERRDDSFYMRRCVELARKATGCTSPNPMVGCVIVKDGEIVGEGFHPKAGQPHAEVFAVKDAGDLAENATAYVSLEPCNHYGRTPPCTEALICAKVKKVIIGMVDPNPIVASKGVERLRGSGIDVITGVEEMLCRKLNEAYIHRMVTGRPFVTLRYSLSFNGRVLNQLGPGAEESGGYYSKLLKEYDGVVISSNLFPKTFSLPTSHETGATQPLRIIIARGVNSLHLPALTTESAGKLVVLAEKTITVEPKLEDVKIVVLEQMSLSSILDYCAHQGLCSVLLDIREDNEVLKELLDDVLDEHLVQKVVMEVCPIWCRGEEAFLAFGRKSFRLRDLETRTENENVVVEGYIL